MITCLEAIFIKLYNGLKEMRAPTIFDRGVSPDHLGRCSLPSSATGTAASDARQRTRRLLEASRSFGKAAAGARAHRAITLTVTPRARALSIFLSFGELDQRVHAIL